MSGNIDWKDKANWTRSRVEELITTTFPATRQGEALQAVDLFTSHHGDAERARVQIACIKLSGGDMDKLKHFIKRATEDYRDVLMWAEM